ERPRVLSRDRRGVQVVNYDFGMKIEESFETLYPLFERMERLCVFQIDYVMADERLVAARQAKDLLQSPAPGQNLPRQFERGLYNPSIGLAIDNPEFQVIGGIRRAAAFDRFDLRKPRRSESDFVNELLDRVFFALDINQHSHPVVEHVPAQ